MTHSDLVCLFYLSVCKKRHSLDRCSGEPTRVQPDRASLPNIRMAPPRGLNLSRLNLKGASETTVKILMLRKHQKGENPVCVSKFFPVVLKILSKVHFSMLMTVKLFFFFTRFVVSTQLCYCCILR